MREEPTPYAVADAALRAQVQAMQQRWERELAQQPKLPAACVKVLKSLRNHWDGLTLFVDNPDLPLDNNQAERALRGPVVGRKNYYGSGAQWSGELSATLFSLFHTLERWQINPRTWLTEYLRACADAGGRVPEETTRGSCPGIAPRRACWPHAARPPRHPPSVPPEAVRYCGRLFSAQELQLIHALIAEDPSRSRAALSRLVCERLDWRRANGQLKDMRLSGRDAAHAPRRLDPVAAAAAPPRQRHPAPSPHRTGGTGVADRGSGR